MAGNLVKWPSKRGPISKIRPSDGCGRDAVPLAVKWWYNFREFGCHLGNVDSDGQAAIRPWWPTITFTPLEKCSHHGPTPLFPWLIPTCVDIDLFHRREIRLRVGAVRAPYADPGVRRTTSGSRQS